ncbi:MAG TPA: hypothetical protein VFR24_13495 [Candidatus Angelobacter sp.]|nr:hypothetical protein [Candidatus Angelobacter sp.]
MQEWINQHFYLVGPLFFIGLWILVAYFIALLSGWRLLAKRFRMQGTFPGQKWHMQNARMLLTNYGNSLTVGADETGLFVVPFILFRAWHPALFIPWTEITAQNKTALIFFKFVELRLGSSESVPFKISAGLAAKLQAAAGPAWPTAYSRAMQAPPPPIA